MDAAAIRDVVVHNVTVTPQGAKLPEHHVNALRSALTALEGTTRAQAVMELVLLAHAVTALEGGQSLRKQLLDLATSLVPPSPSAGVTATTLAWDAFLPQSPLPPPSGGGVNLLTLRTRAGQPHPRTGFL